MTVVLRSPSAPFHARELPETETMTQTFVRDAANDKTLTWRLVDVDCCDAHTAAVSSDDDDRNVLIYNMVVADYDGVEQGNTCKSALPGEYCEFLN